MNNFLDFIVKDINAKKTLLSTLPTKTKTNKKKFNANIKDMENKYNEYKDSVRNYILAKNRAIKIKDDRENLDKLNDTLINLENVKFLLNPSNSYFEKMGFDDLLYRLNNYYTFNFKSLNEIINGFLDKFELAGIKLTSDDFKYTCYVHEYMSSFLDVRNKKSLSYEKVSEIFEQIYWVNPDIISHIELNFRKLIKDNHRKFNSYIIKLQKEVMVNNNIKNYQDCLEKLKSAYIELNFANKENIYDIANLAKTGKININEYLENSKVKTNAVQSLFYDENDFNDKDKLNRICDILEKLKLNVIEYSNYAMFLPLFEDFKKEYKKEVDSKEKTEYKELKEVVDKIDAKEKELYKLNKKIFGGRPGFFEFKSDSNLKQMKINSVCIAKELYELYGKYDKAYFKDKVIQILNNTISISDVLNLYYSYDYFKKITIQRVYNLGTYEEIEELSEKFDLYAMNPTNIIVNGLLVFSDTDIAKIIINKYRLSNIKLTLEELDPDNLDNLLNKILLILRINKINNSSTSANKIWFMTEVEKILSKESIKK